MQDQTPDQDSTSSGRSTMAWNLFLIVTEYLNARVLSLVTRSMSYKGVGDFLEWKRGGIAIDAIAGSDLCLQRL